VKGFVLAGMKSGWLNTINENKEGYIMISEPTSQVNFLGLIDRLYKRNGNKRIFYFS